MSFLKKYTAFTSIFVLAFSLSLGGCSILPWGDKDDEDDLAFEEGFGDDLDKDFAEADSRSTTEDDFFADDKDLTEPKGQQSDIFEEEMKDPAGFVSVDQKTDQDEIKADVETLQSQQEVLISRVRELQEIIQTLEPRLTATQDSLQNSLAASSGQSLDLVPEIASLREEVNRLNDEINRLKMSNAPSRVARTTPRKSRRPAKSSAKTPAEYNQALAAYRSGKHEESLLMFQELSLKNPPENLKDNILFWIGSNYMKLGLYDDAIAQFQGVLDQYPKGNKVHDSRFLMGVCYQKKGDTGKALDILDVALKTDPPSEIRKKIEQQLMEIK